VLLGDNSKKKEKRRINSTFLKRCDKNTQKRKKKAAAILPAVASNTGNLLITAYLPREILKLVVTAYLAAY
jgi:hypothetical protein